MYRMPNDLIEYQSFLNSVQSMMSYIRGVQSVRPSATCFSREPFRAPPLSAIGKVGDDGGHTRKVVNHVTENCSDTDGSARVALPTV